MRILLATDGSHPAHVATELVASVNWPPPSVIRAVTVVAPSPRLFVGPWISVAGDLHSADADRVAAADLHGADAARVAAAEQLVEEATRRLGRSDCRLERSVVWGRPATAIVDEARDFQADLVVMGNRGHGAIASMVLGSVAAEVADHAACPVLIARRPLLTRVILAHDGSDYARAAEDLLASWKFLSHVALEVVSVAEVADPFRVPPAVMLLHDCPPDYFESGRELIEQQRRVAASSAARLRRAGLRAIAAVDTGDATTALLRRAENSRADMIVVATHGRTGLKRVVLGSVARKVMQHARTSVLVVRPRVLVREQEPEARLAATTT